MACEYAKPRFVVVTCPNGIRTVRSSGTHALLQQVFHFMISAKTNSLFFIVVFNFLCQQVRILVRAYASRFYIMVFLRLPSLSLVGITGLFNLESLNKK